MDYAYVLRRAWQTLWRWKVLWLLGFLAALRPRTPNIGWNDLPGEAQHRLAEFAAGPYYVPVIVATGLVALFVYLGLVFVNALGRGALVDQVNLVENGGTPAVKSGWEVGKEHAQTVFFLTLLLRSPLYLLGAIGFIPPLFLSLRSLALSPETAPDVTLLFEMLGASLFCFTPALCLGAILWFPVNVMQRLAVRACLLEGKTVWGGMRRAWEIVRSSFGIVLVLALILLGIGSVFFLLISAPVGLLAVTLATSRVLLTISVPSKAFLVILVATAVWWLLGGALNSVIEVFSSAFWTVAYRQLTGLGRTGEEPRFTP